MINITKARIKTTYQGQELYVAKMVRSKKGNKLSLGNKNKAIVFEDKSLAFDAWIHIHHSLPSAIVVDLNDNELFNPMEDPD